MERSRRSVFCCGEELLEMLERVAVVMGFLVGGEELGGELSIGGKVEIGECLIVDFLEVGHGES